MKIDLAVRRLISLIFFLLSGFSVLSQDLAKIGSKHPVKINGGISTSHQFNTSPASSYTYFIGANLNVDLYGWAIPLSFNYSNRQSSFQQPFNSYGISPTYKSLTLHLGYRSMNFSGYTYSAQLFKGIGIEIAPESPFRISIFYGQLQKAVSLDTLNNSADFAFRRMGYGFKADYNGTRITSSVILFRARDGVSSVSFIPVDSNVLPSENLALSLAASIAIIKGLNLSIELASSAFTADIRTEESGSNPHNLYSVAGPLFKPRSSSDYFLARKSSFSYTFHKSTIAINYEKVDPGYKTLGGYFFNDDLKNWTLSLAQSLKDRMTLNFNGGIEKNNLDNTEVNETKRLVGSVNLSYSPSEKTNLTGSYSNFKTYTNVRPLFETINQPDPGVALDTLNYTLLNQSATLGGSFILGDAGDCRQNLNINLSFQGNRNTEQSGTNSGVLVQTLSYSKSWTDQNTSLSISFNSTEVKGQISNTTFGPILVLNRSFLEKKLRSSISTGYNQSISGHSTSARSFLFRWNNNMALKKRHNFNLGLSYQNRFLRKPEKSASFNANFAYSFTF